MHPRFSTGAAVAALLCGCATTSGPEGSSDTGLIAQGRRFIEDKVPLFDDGKPVIAKLRPGPYEPSNEKIGDERDIDDKRVRYGLVPLAPVSAYATRVLDRLKAASGVTDVPGRVLIAANDQLDAGSTPDGNIFISLGYLRSLDNEDQFAALLAHELAHVLLHHHDSSWFSRKQKEMMALFEDGAMLRNVLENIGAGGQGKVAKFSAGQKETLERMLLLVKLNDRALGPAWNRQQEADADRLAVDLMERAGYSVQDGMSPWLDKIAEWDEHQAKVRAELTAQRQSSLEALAAQGQLEKMARATLDNAMKDVLEEIGRSHEGGEKRNAEIAVYLKQVYPNGVTKRRATVEPYRQLLAQREVRSTVDNYRQAFAARNQITSRQFAQATPVLRQLTGSGPIALHALPNYLMFEAQRGTGGGTAAEVALKRSLAAPEPTWEPFDSAAAFYGARNQKDAVRTIGREAMAKFNQAPSAYPRLIALYVRHGLKDDATSVMTECRRQQAMMRTECEKAYKP